MSAKADADAVVGTLVKHKDKLKSLKPFSSEVPYIMERSRFCLTSAPASFGGLHFVSGILNVLLNIFFIPYFGVMAAAVNTFICIAGANYGIFC